jgi:hypothetical protein
MALVSVGSRPVMWPPPTSVMPWVSISNGGSQQLNATSTRAAHVFKSRFSGTIAKLGIRIATATTAQTMRLGLYTVSATDGNSTGTLVGSSNYATFTPASATNFELTLPASAAVTAETWYAIVVEWDSTTGDINFNAAGGSWDLFTNVYYHRFTSGAWASKVIGGPIQVWAVLDDGTYADVYGYPATLYATHTANLNTAVNDEWASKITVPYTCRVSGIWANIGTAAGADFEAILYNGTTALATRAVDGDQPASTSVAYRLFEFASPQTLAAGTTVRAAIRPTTTANVTFRRYGLQAAGAERGFGWPSGTCESYRVDQGAWTDVTTNIQSIGLAIDQFDDGTGGGGGMVPMVGRGSPFVRGIS